MAVFVLDRKGKSLMPCSERRAPIHKMYSFTIRLIIQGFKSLWFPVYVSTDAQTKSNHKQQGFEKTHALDAACVDQIRALQDVHQPTLHIKCRARDTYQGRVAIRQSGYFNIQTKDTLVQGVHHRYCVITQRADGYHYQLVA